MFPCAAPVPAPQACPIRLATHQQFSALGRGLTQLGTTWAQHLTSAASWLTVKFQHVLLLLFQSQSHPGHRQLLVQASHNSSEMALTALPAKCCSAGLINGRVSHRMPDRQLHFPPEFLN